MLACWHVGPLLSGGIGRLRVRGCTHLGYTAASDSFTASAQTYPPYSPYLTNSTSVVSPDGSLIALSFNGGVSILDTNFHAVENLPRLDGGVAFDPVQNLLYGASTTADQVIAYDTTTWKERFRLDIGEPIRPVQAFGNGVMTVSDDGSELFLSTPSGVRMIDLPASTGVASRFAVTGFPTLISAGTPATFTVTALDPAGNVAAGYTGTVHFATGDPAAKLPDDYTFTPDDQGSATFTATLGTAGTWSITATDADNGLQGTTGNVQVHTDPISLIPVANRRDLVYDPVRNLLYITTTAGTVERFDVTTQTLLAPLAVGGSLNGADISADGSYLYVAEGQRGATQGFIRQVGLDDGSVTNFAYDLGGGTSGAWSVVVTANGTVLSTEIYEGSDWVPLYQLDPNAGTFTSRRTVRHNSLIDRSGDGTLVFGREADISNGPIFTYNANSDTFPSSASTNTFLDNALAAVNADGSLIAMIFNGGVAVLDQNLNTVRVLGNLNGGVAFDPVQNLLYAVSTQTSQVIAYDTTTWTEQFRLNIGESVSAAQAFGRGVMTVSADGSMLFLSTTSGVRILNLPTGPRRAHQPSGRPLAEAVGLANVAVVFVTGDQVVSVSTAPGTRVAETVTAAAPTATVAPGAASHVMEVSPVSMVHLHSRLEGADGWMAGTPDIGALLFGSDLLDAMFAGN